MTRLSTTLFCCIPAGEYAIGSSAEVRASLALGVDDDAVPRVVRLPAFMISVRPISVAEWRKFDTATGREWRFWDRVASLGLQEHDPIVFVDWYDAAKYAEWFSTQFSCNAGLPSEDEWEVACRLSQERVTDERTALAPLNMHTHGVMHSCDPAPRDVPLHCLGMGQIVREWCVDEYVWTSFGEPEESFRMRARRTVKGSRSPTKEVRCGHRSDRPPSTRAADLGFRLVVSGDASTAR